MKFLIGYLFVIVVGMAPCILFASEQYISTDDPSVVFYENRSEGIFINTEHGNIEIYGDGRVVIPDALNLDDAAREFWRGISEYAPLYCRE